MLQYKGAAQTKQLLACQQVLGCNNEQLAARSIDTAAAA